MRTINTFESVINKLHQMSENYFDETIPVTDMMFHSIDRMWISGKRSGFCLLLSGCLPTGCGFRTPIWSDVCGFGGTFSIKFGDVSGAIVD